MNSVILISAWSRNAPNGQPSAKNYPFWPEVVRLLRLKGIKTVQVAVRGEEQIGADETLFDVSLSQLTSLLKQSKTWIAVDNFFPHFAHYNKKRGVAIFAKSDPNIFGYPENVNLLKHRRYLRARQFDYWNNINLDKDSFVSPDKVVEEVLKMT